MGKKIPGRLFQGAAFENLSSSLTNEPYQNEDLSKSRDHSQKWCILFR